MNEQIQACRECKELTEHRLTCVLNRSGNVRCLVQDSDRAASAPGDEAYYEKLLEKMNQEWAETDTAIRELCRPFTDVEGDSYGVPTLPEVVAKTIVALRAKENPLVVDAIELQAILHCQECKLCEDHMP